MVSQSMYVAPSTTWTSGDSLTASTTTYRYVPGYRYWTREKPGPPGEGGPGGWEGDYERWSDLAGSARSSIRLARTYNGPDWTSVAPAIKTMPSPWPKTQISAASSAL